MFGALVIFGLGILVGLIIADNIMFGPHYYKLDDEKPITCPHGWEDWDDCPDCSH